MNTDQPRVHLPRPRRAGLPAVLAVFLGASVGLILGHPYLGGIVGLVLWARVRSRDGVDQSL